MVHADNDANGESDVHGEEEAETLEHNMAEEENEQSSSQESLMAALVTELLGPVEGNDGTTFCPGSGVTFPLDEVDEAAQVER